MSDCVLITGGAGFIGSNFILDWFEHKQGGIIVNLDKITYAGNPSNLAPLLKESKYRFVQGDICDRTLVKSLLAQYQPRAILNFAAETHVDRSIAGPEAFLTTNIMGTYTLLQAAHEYYSTLHLADKEVFRFLHISTDEVYGTLSPQDEAFHEGTTYKPNSPYAASKAASDHLVRAWHHTYHLPTLVTNCSNNYGPLHFPEKLIPLVITNALAGRPLPIYGDGGQIRDWLFVRDHCSAIRTVLQKGRVGETYNVGGGNQRTNLDVVQRICQLLDELRADSPHVPHARLIEFITDRPGHDRRYAIDARKIESELGWVAQESFDTGLRKTVQWYLNNSAWLESVTSGAYRDWIDANYSDRVVTQLKEAK